jgi:hypothetical protein
MGRLGDLIDKTWHMSCRVDYTWDMSGCTPCKGPAPISETSEFEIPEQPKQVSLFNEEKNEPL